MKRIKNVLLTFVFAALLVAPAAAVTFPAPASANSENPSCESRVLLLPPWYRGLTQGQDCSLTGPGSDIGAYVTKIALNIIEIVVIIVGYISAYFIIAGGFRFLTAGGDPGAVEKARKSIFNAVIGLAIALSAVAITNFIFGILP